MTRFAFAASAMLAFAACAGATPIPTISLIPASGTVGGLPGSVVGWGFTLSYDATSDWVVLTGSVFTGSSTYGNYVDYLAVNDYVAGPGYAPLDQAWDAGSQSGVGEFDINPTALPGADISGDLVIHYTVFDVDPNSPVFDPDTDTVVADATVSNPAAAQVTPEPSSLALLLGSGLFTLAFVARRRARRHP